MRALIALLALAFAGAAHAAPPIWVVKDADSEMVLFGSIHVLPPTLKWRTPALDAALAKADDLWFELPAGPVSDMLIGRLAAKVGVLPEGQSLFTLLPPADALRLMKVADAYKVDRLTLDRLEPWLAEVVLAGAAYGRAGAESHFGVEKVVEVAAPPSIPRHALETIEQQIAIFDEMPMPQQIASLRESVAEMEANPRTYEDLLDAWMAGDVRKLDEEALTPLRKSSPEIYRRLLTDRNADWVKQIRTRLDGKGRTVVVVGIGHLVGADGVPARLRTLGYSVTGP